MATPECARFVGHHLPILLESYLNEDESGDVEDAMFKVFDTLNEWCVKYKILTVAVRGVVL